MRREGPGGSEDPPLLRFWRSACSTSMRLQTRLQAQQARPAQGSGRLFPPDRSRTARKPGSRRLAEARTDHGRAAYRRWIVGGRHRGRRRMVHDSPGATGRPNGDVYSQDVQRRDARGDPEARQRAKDCRTCKPAWARAAIPTCRDRARCDRCRRRLPGSGRPCHLSEEPGERAQAQRAHRGRELEAGTRRTRSSRKRPRGRSVGHADVRAARVVARSCRINTCWCWQMLPDHACRSSRLPSSVLSHPGLDT